MAYETAVFKQLEAYTAKHLSRMGGVSPHIRLAYNLTVSYFNEHSRAGAGGALTDYD